MKQTLISLLLASCSVPALFAQAQPSPVAYDISFPNAAHHEARVQATFSGIRTPVLEVVLSRSSPGRYALHEFPKNLYNLTAKDDSGRDLPVARISPSQWTVSGHKGTVILQYTLFGDRTDGTFDAFDETHAHLNGPATFLWARGMEGRPVRVRFQLPEGTKWTVATQLKPEADGTYSAPNRDMLMDGPVEISKHDLPEWTVGDSRFRLSLHHKGTPEEAAAYAQMAKAVVTEAEGVFGAFPKYDNGDYTFLLDYLPYASGDGMEHRNSTVISGAGTLKDGAAQLIGTVSHEFFHSWNVRRIRPKSLEPFDFEAANLSSELWFAEGFTNYYGPLVLKRAGLNSVDRFESGMARAVSAVLTAPGRQVFSAVEMSNLAPFVDGARSLDPLNFQNNFISYYTYGQAIALGVDLTIRTRYPGKSLDDWMRRMWKNHPDINRPYTLENLQTALAEVTDPAFAADIFRKHIVGKEPMDYAPLLASAGFELRRKTGDHAWLGAEDHEFSDAGLVVSGAVLRDSPAYAAGLDRGDTITEFEGKTLKTESEYTKWLDSRKPGDKVKLKVDGRTGKRDVEATLASDPQMEIVTFEQAGKTPSPAQLALRSQWLGSKAVHPLPELKKFCPVCQRQHPFEFEHCPYDGYDLGIVPGKADPPARPARGRRAN
jgi:predicted metalloprotease with PDZ domain